MYDLTEYIHRPRHSSTAASSLTHSACGVYVHVIDVAAALARKALLKIVSEGVMGACPCHAHTARNSENKATPEFIMTSLTDIAFIGREYIPQIVRSDPLTI